LVGTYVVQRVSIREQAGQYLFHDLELTSSSLQQRAYESWLQIVRGGKVTVQMPGSSTNNLVTYTSTPGSPWVVPANVTSVTFTCCGGSGGGGGAMYYKNGFPYIPFTFISYSNGGTGGASGLAVAVVSVLAGDSFTIVVGAGGTGGAASLMFFDPGPLIVAGDGTIGSASSVTRSAIEVCQGAAGGGGTGAGDYWASIPAVYGPGTSNGTNGANGSGIGDAITVGGGRSGGAGGVYQADGSPGTSGYVTIAW
jgi:hypothetical protein